MISCPLVIRKIESNSVEIRLDNNRIHAALLFTPSGLLRNSTQNTVVTNIPPGGFHVPHFIFSVHIDVGTSYSNQIRGYSVVWSVVYVIFILSSYVLINCTLPEITTLTSVVGRCYICACHMVSPYFLFLSLT